jgi:hypothetical protein
MNGSPLNPYMRSLRRDCLGPFQDAAVVEVIEGVEQVFRQVAETRGIDEIDLRAWVAWASLRVEAE